jgi:rRNA small subunit pseudouridine methyltransferase Nep1
MNLVFTETALELVPREILLHPSVRRNSKRRKKRAEETLLDRSLHHFAMGKLPNEEKRGRPDIIHFCLLITQGSPLNTMGKLKVSINLINGFELEVDASMRPPRDCIRFNSLMEQLLINGVIPLTGKPLMKIHHNSLSEQVKKISPSRIIALSSHGKQSSFENVSKILASEVNPAVLIGAHPKGPMSDNVLDLADAVYSVYPNSLEAWTVTSRIIYEYEKSI